MEKIYHVNSNQKSTGIAIPGLEENEILNKKFSLNTKKDILQEKLM